MRRICPNWPWVPEGGWEMHGAEPPCLKLELPLAGPQTERERSLCLHAPEILLSFITQHSCGTSCLIPVHRLRLTSLSFFPAILTVCFLSFKTNAFHHMICSETSQTPFGTSWIKKPAGMGGASGRRYIQATSFYCTLQILGFLQIEGLWQLYVQARLSAPFFLQ